MQSSVQILVQFLVQVHLSHFWANVIFAIPTKSLSIHVSTLSVF